MVVFLAAWIINRKMDIPDTISSIRQIRISDRDPGKKKKKRKNILTKIYDSSWNFHEKDSLNLFQMKITN